MSANSTNSGNAAAVTKPQLNNNLLSVLANIDLKVGEVPLEGSTRTSNGDVSGRAGDGDVLGDGDGLCCSDLFHVLHHARDKDAGWDRRKGVTKFWLKKTRSNFYTFCEPTKEFIERPGVLLSKDRRLPHPKHMQRGVCPKSDHLWLVQINDSTPRLELSRSSCLMFSRSFSLASKTAIFSCTSFSCSAHLFSACKLDV